MTNYNYYNTDIEVLKRIQLEFEEYVGRETKLFPAKGQLIVFDKPQKQPTQSKRNRPVRDENEEVKTGPRYTKRESAAGVIPRP